MSVALEQPLFQQNDTTDQAALVARLMLRDLVNERPGVVQAGAMKCSQRSAGANNSVDIATGSLIIPGTHTSNQGYYHVTNNAVTNLPMSTAAHGSLPRIDTVIVRVRDGFYTGSDNDAQFVYVPGTAAASPAAPNLDALGYVNYWRLANISVPANDNTITDAEVTDVRTSGSLTPAQGYATAVGGCIVCTITTRPTNARQGQMIYETDTGRLLVQLSIPPAQSWGTASNNLSWTTFTPTFTGTTVGSGGSTYGRYIKLGRLAIASFGFILGTSGFSVASLLAWDPPSVIALDTTSQIRVVSTGWAQDGNTRYGGVGIQAANDSQIRRWCSQATGIGWGSGSPFTWGASDAFYGQALYETSTAPSF